MSFFADEDGQDVECLQCPNTAEFGGLCRDCHQREHGPIDDEPRYYSGPYEPAGYRESMIDAGRGHLVR